MTEKMAAVHEPGPALMVYTGKGTTPLTVFASLTIEARATKASTCGGLTAAIVLTGTLQEAGSTIAPSRAGCTGTGQMDS